MLIKVKYPLVMLLLIIISIVTLTFMNITLSEFVIIKSIEDSQFQLAKNSMDRVDKNLYDNGYLDIKTIADSVPIEELIIDNNAENRERAQESLEELLLNTGPWDKLEVFDINGNLIVSNQKEDIESRIEEHSDLDASSFQEALKGVYVSDLIISEETGKPTIVFAAPVFDESIAGKPVVGVTVGNFAWQVILEILDGIKTDDVHLLNKNGIIIGDTKEHGEKSQYSEDWIKKTLEQGDHTGIHNKGIHIQESVLLSAVKQKGFLSYKGSGWVMVIETKTSNIFAPLRDLIYIEIIIAVVIALISIIVGFITSLSITKPITDLKNSAERMGSGDFSYPVEVPEEKGELNDLGKTMEALRNYVLDKNLLLANANDELKKANKDLDKKVRQRTKELEGSYTKLKNKADELERFSELTQNREIKMIELKRRIKELEKRLKK